MSQSLAYGKCITRVSAGPSSAVSSSRDIETEKPSQLTRKENANFRISKKKNEKIWILKTVYGKHSIYFSDF